MYMYREVCMRAKKRACFSYSQEHLDKLKEMSSRTLIPMSALIRKALKDFFDKYNKGNV